MCHILGDGDYCYEPDADNCYCDCKANLVPIPGTGRHACEDLFNYALGTYTWPQSWPEQCMAHLVLIAPPPQVRTHKQMLCRVQ